MGSLVAASNLLSAAATRENNSSFEKIYGFFFIKLAFLKIVVQCLEMVTIL